MLDSQTHFLPQPFPPRVGLAQAGSAIPDAAMWSESGTVDDCERVKGAAAWYAYGYPNGWSR